MADANRSRETARAWPHRRAITVARKQITLVTSHGSTLQNILKEEGQP